MEKDETLLQIFQDYTPELRGQTEFMLNLQRKLDAIEFIKQRQERQIRFCRYAIIAAFVLEMIASAIFLVMLQVQPLVNSFFALQNTIFPFTFLGEYAHLFPLAGIVLLGGFCIVLIIAQWFELANLLNERKQVRPWLHHKSFSDAN